MSMRNNGFERQRQINEVLTLLDLTYLSPTTVAMPMQAWLRIATACDLTCPLCERQHIRPVDSGFMDLGEFTRLTDQLAGVQKAHLFGLGEPFLNKRFFEYVQACHARGLEVSTTTHGMHINESLARRIIESGMEELAISMDAAEPELFNRLREGADFETVCRNVRRLADLKIEMESSTPVIQICCTVSTENLHQCVPLVQLAGRLGANRVCFSDVTAPTPEHVRFCVTNREQLQNTVAQSQTLGKQLGLEVIYFRQNGQPFGEQPPVATGQPHGCAMAWTDFIVDRLGGTKFCCYIKDPLPSAFGRSPREAVNSPGHVRNRQDLMDGRIRVECQGCPNLVRNSWELVETTLREAENRIQRSQHLTEADRVNLRGLVQEYRTRACQKFGRPASPNADAPIRRWARAHLPLRVRRVIRRALSWASS